MREPQDKTAPITIVSVVTQFESGGAQRAALRLSKALRERGYHTETWFLYRRPSGVAYNGETYTKIMLNQPPKGWRDMARVLFNLSRSLNEVKPDVVLSYAHNASVLAQSLAWFKGISVRIASPRNPSWSLPKFAKAADQLLGTLGVYHSITPVSEATKLSFKRYPPSYYKRLHVIPNAVEFCPSKLNGLEARAKFGLPLDVPIIGSIGRLARQKNQEVLIRAMASLTDTHLAIVGDGELKAQLKGLADELQISERIHFLGTVAAGDIPDFLRALNIFAMPSLFEGMSNALLEALCEGLPIVSSDIPPQVEVLVGEDKAPAGILLPANDVGAWASTFADLLSNDKLQAELRQRAKERAKDFSPERMVDAYEKLILQLLERHGKRKR